ncbi:F-box only protein 43 [Melanotaenia boesemani]|uniref:F-box only protein 43 n=1 Tax=Melanotaenia boesemani TaxID=1250792 RepID=UPI001C047767|nr:F-box only protein 43 [Melanotaenia boesemani]
MQYTPESAVHLKSFKALHCYDVCSDSGYSGLFQSPQSTAGVDSCQSFSLEELTETPKENLKLTVSPKEKNRDPVRFLGKDSREFQPSAVTWCETPKTHKRDGMFRQRLPMCKSTTVKNDNIKWTESSVGVQSEHWLSASFDSLDVMTGGESNTLNPDQDLLLSGRKRRLLFTQVRTSTLEDGKLNTGHLSSFERSVSLTETDFSESTDQLDTDTSGHGKFLPVLTAENSQSSVNSATNVLCDSSSALSTPSFTRTPKYIRSLCEDSGFGSLTLDKSQDSSVDHDGSFQELLLSAPRGNCETPNLADAKRRSRLQRQHRLSTLKEGGSQSEEDLADMKHQHPFKHHSCSKEDEVFADDATPCSVLSAKSLKNLTFNGVTFGKHSHNTPLRATTAKPEHTTPNTPAITPLSATPINLSLTPALELVHVMCQHKAQMCAVQSPCLKEELKMTAALANTQMMFRTSMPLAGLIGRKMGVRKVDILTELKKRNLRHILAAIFSILSSESIYRCGQVCKSWNETIQQDKQASSRRRNHLSEVEAALELGGAVHIADAETRVALLKRSALKMVQPQSRTSSFCTPQSANSTLTPLQHSTLQSSSGRRDKFLEVAKTLFNDECLKPCPRCEHPAKCHSVKREGVCSRADCGFQFCTSCLCAFHGSRDCTSWSSGRRKKDSLLPGSAQSKRNVRRL